MNADSPLYQARMENVKLVTELRELREQMGRSNSLAMEVAVWTKRYRRARDRADAHRARVLELENAISDWLIGDIDEDGLAAFLGKVKAAA